MKARSTLVLVCGIQRLFVTFRTFTGFKVLPPPLGNWHWPDAWVRNIIALISPPRIRVSFPHQLVELLGLLETLEVRVLQLLVSCAD